MNPKHQQIHFAKIILFFENKRIFGSITLELHPDSALADQAKPPECVLYTEVTQGKYMREVSVIPQSWLTDIAPHYYQNNNE